MFVPECISNTNIAQMDSALTFKASVTTAADNFWIFFFQRNKIDISCDLSA